ncbi:integrase core domain-containing protein [Thermodesulfobacterium hveragerdense]
MSLEEVREIVKKWVENYNKQRPHSALEYRAPMEVWHVSEE